MHRLLYWRPAPPASPPSPPRRDAPVSPRSSPHHTLPLPPSHCPCFFFFFFFSLLQCLSHPYVMISAPFSTQTTNSGWSSHSHRREAERVCRGQRLRARGCGEGLQVLTQEPRSLRRLRRRGACPHLQGLRAGVRESPPIPSPLMGLIMIIISFCFCFFRGGGRDEGFAPATTLQHIPSIRAR